MWVGSQGQGYVFQKGFQKKTFPGALSVNFSQVLFRKYLLHENEGPAHRSLGPWALGVSTEGPGPMGPMRPAPMWAN